MGLTAGGNTLAERTDGVELEASEGSASFSRMFAEFIPYYMLPPRIRVGVGVVNTLSPEYSDPWDTFDFDNAFGMVSEVNWQHSRKAWWGVRYVSMEYTVNSYNGFSVSNGPVIDGSYLGNL
ncbi:MAG: hypothetical protein OQL09_02400 [Gammaproteobacteria bacterium]|nr:hypothetical protein [Gammaproteobacteria bacterium]